MAIYKDGHKIKDRIHDGRFIGKAYKDSRLIYQRKLPQKFTNLIFDQTISDPASITGHGQGAILDIISKMRRCLCKAELSWKTQISNPSWLNWEQFGNDPSPDGWRIPTREEFIALDGTYRGPWITISNINGRRLGTASGPFFPASGYRASGVVDSQGTYGYYWSSSANNSSRGYYLSFYNNSAEPSDYGTYTYGFSIRCVRDPSITNYTTCPAGETQVGNLIWANSNLSGNKTFCQDETDYGCYFQFGQNLPLSNDGTIPANQLIHTKICYLDNENSNYFQNQWKSSISNPSLLPWAQFGIDPSPKGWRLPTSAELVALDAAYGGPWTTVNGINGRYFGSSSGPFFPAAGRRFYMSGAVTNQGTGGYYWSLTQRDALYGYLLYFDSSAVYPDTTAQYNDGSAVRCVRDITTTSYIECPAGEIQIDNLIWAKSNLKAAGEFCEKETDYGCYFQWGQNTALSSDSNVNVTTETPILTGANGDVMVYKPAFWYKYVPDPLGTTRSFGYDISEKPIDGGIYSPESLIGAYKSNVVSNKVYSRSGVYPSYNIGYSMSSYIYYYLQYALSRGFGYSLVDYEQRCMLTLLFFAKYGIRDSSSVLGLGSTGHPLSGMTNNIGNNDTENPYRSPTSFCGVEGIIGGMPETLREMGSWGGTTFVGRRLDGTSFTLSTEGIWQMQARIITEIYASIGPYFDIWPLRLYTSGIMSPNYYDTMQSVGVAQVPFYLTAGDGGDGAGNGLLFVNTTVERETPQDQCAFCSRLAFRGTIIEEPNPTVFKNLPLI